VITKVLVCTVQYTKRIDRDVRWSWWRQSGTRETATRRERPSTGYHYDTDYEFFEKLTEIDLQWISFLTAQRQPIDQTTAALTILFCSFTIIHYMERGTARNTLGKTTKMKRAPKHISSSFCRCISIFELHEYSSEKYTWRQVEGHRLCRKISYEKLRNKGFAKCSFGGVPFLREKCA
jgi:hypothetical protein